MLGFFCGFLALLIVVLSVSESRVRREVKQERTKRGLK